ncbi:MAG: hypothetical protein ACKO3G_14480 [Planctomycetaceae bacterium]
MSQGIPHADGPRMAFPDHRAVIAEDARRFRQLTPRERWQEIFVLRAWGSRLADSTPRRAAIGRSEAEAEERWQAIQRELFARHAG